MLSLFCNSIVFCRFCFIFSFFFCFSFSFCFIFCFGFCFNIHIGYFGNICTLGHASGNHNINDSRKNYYNKCHIDIKTFFIFSVRHNFFLRFF
ncbi:MAG: hypothetical protein E7621_05225 [Ruminococcaceae bacterium]|nr:hypothetical protein [Oscillospiraceae bacterium]